jgi:hypothetical protein
MNNYEKHAMIEFRATGWSDEHGKFKDEMQEAICKHVLELLDVFHGEGHSGTTAPYTIDLFKKLAMFEPVAPLTGEDWEWANVSENGGKNGGPLYQNKRCGHVFKDSTGAYDIDGIIFYDWYTNEKGEIRKSYFTGQGSRVPVTFPYVPKSVYRERPSE